MQQFYKVLFVGAPNSGKSAFLECVLNQNREENSKSSEVENYKVCLLRFYVSNLTCLCLVLTLLCSFRLTRA